MATSQQNNGDEKDVSSELPVDINDWNKDHVRQWLLNIKVDEDDAEILYKEKVNGAGLLLLETSDLTELGLSFNAKKLIIHNRDQLKQDLSTKSCSLKPYPFKRFNAAHRYKENSILDVTETGPVDLIQPCHEFKAFTNTTEENAMKKYTFEVIRFAAACMNSRTNGTIHFGVADKPHGQILGISVQKKERFEEQQSKAIEKHFQQNYVDIAKRCIMPPRFVEVLKADMTSTDKCVIEVDIEPSFIVCKEFYFNTHNLDKGQKMNVGKSFLVRKDSSSANLITPGSSRDYELYIADMPKLSQLRKDAEEKHLSVIRNSVEGSKLCEMLTGGTQSLDKSHYMWYVVVANKSHPVQLKNLGFLTYMDLMAVLDFDPESAVNGLNTLFEDRKTNNHLPAEYKITWAVGDIIDKLKLTRNTSWVFCNGGYKEESPSDVQNWSTEKGSSVRDVVSFLCRKDVLPNKKFLIIFLLLSQVTDAQDPLLETFSMFLQEMKGTNQILCICDTETTYTYWKDLIMGRYKDDISKRCISELSFAEINGTVLSLWSENRKSERFLPGVGDSKVVLSRKSEDTLEMLSILCVNQCDGGNEDKKEVEERFYKGGKVSWWNFYFSEQPGSMPFIKRDKLVYIVNTIIPEQLSMRRACVCFNILHLPGCGGTTLAMHVLWTFKDKYRCAVLKDQTDDYTKVAEQVVQLLTYKTEEQSTRLPVLLMIDDFEDICDVKNLQLQIEEECLKQKIFSKSPQVILINCMRVESREQAEEMDDSVFIGNSLSEREQDQFEEKLKEFGTTNTNTETFYGFMILKTNFSSKYIQGVVKNTLKCFNFQHQHAKLFAVLVLLDVYCRNASLSVSACEEFLHLQTTENCQSCTIEDGFENLSSLLTRCTISSKVIFDCVKVIHSSIAQQCLKEFAATHGVTKADITNILLTADLFNDCFLGKQKLMSDLHSMLVKRQHSTKGGSLFSPLIHDIMKETPGLEENILNNAAKFYRKDAVIFQLLARYYLKNKNKDFKMATIWAKKAKDNSKDNSYICDTVAQVLKSELKNNFDQDRNDPIKPDSLQMYLTLAESATKACKETQQIAQKEAMARFQRPNNYNTYNTAGRLGELQVAVSVIEILQKMPPFKSDHQLLGQVLSGKIKLDDLAREQTEHKAYFDVLQKHVRYLLDLKETMKQHFNFHDKYFVNLAPFLPEKDKQKELTHDKVKKCFQKYLHLFGEMNWSELVNNDRMTTMIKVEKTQQCLERNNADSYTGLLEYLYKENSASILEEIIQQYDFILRSAKDRYVKDVVSFIYANVILANIYPESQYIRPYQYFFPVLYNLIEKSTTFSESLPLHYISLLMLWKYPILEITAMVSQIRHLYSNEWKAVGNGRRAAIHFFLGNEKGYKGLMSQRDLNKCLGPKQNIATKWDNENTWKKVRDTGKLYRTSGVIRHNCIAVADSNLVVYPMFRSQLRKEFGTRVTFFTGFSMNGPVALDIDFES
ncbi:sterile alpha motif domain-containing protein 9 [Paramisgurnus dabryanus]|uniref:sterile alpha motif domain-containing protein 9 n=1 Tax=Paramisgurnus dabryanus TaxID=90735 RepID=UPI0031F3833C